MKVCTKCAIKKPLEEFNLCLADKGKTYLSPDCNQCSKKTKVYSKTQKRVLDCRRYTANRHAKKLAAGIGFTNERVHKLMADQKELCVYCKKNIKNKFHVDHIIPISRGGVHDDTNIQLLCPSCNLRKHDKNHEEFLTYLREPICGIIY